MNRKQKQLIYDEYIKKTLDRAPALDEERRVKIVGLFSGSTTGQARELANAS